MGTETERNISPFAEPERLLRASGEGSMQHHVLFPGIELSRTRFSASRISMTHEAHAGVLEINYCKSGRIGWDMKGGFSVYLGPGDLDVHSMEACAVSDISLPLGCYEGISLLIDPARLEAETLLPIREAGIRSDQLLQKLCPDGRPLALPGNREIDRIFSVLYEPLPETLLLPYERLSALSLLLYLEQLNPQKTPQLTRYYSAQAETIRRIHALLTEDLTRRYTIEELSRKYLMNSSTLKAVFKAVYSQPIGAYMREYRIRRAMELLQSTDSDISDIARRVGYESQGKFTAAFKELAQMLPTEYRRQKRQSGSPHASGS